MSSMADMGSVGSSTERSPEAEFNEKANSEEYVRSLDARDPLRQFRDEFVIPSIPDLKRKTLAPDEGMCDFRPNGSPWYAN